MHNSLRAGVPGAVPDSPAGPSQKAPASSLSLLASELKVLFRRRRTWAMLLALAAIAVLIAVAVRLSSRVPAGRGPAFLDRITQNGLFVAVTAMLVSVPLFLPLTIGVVAGDTIAGEASLGTLRYLLVAPAPPVPPAGTAGCPGGPRRPWYRRPPRRWAGARTAAPQPALL